MPEPIYLDHNATTPIAPEVVEVMRQVWADSLQNPASQHELGRRAQHVLEESRGTIADLFGATDDRVVFTSGGTESNNLAVMGLVQRAGASSPPRSTPFHLVVSGVEHPSIASLADELARRGHAVDRISVDKNGVIRADTFEPLLRPNTAVVAAILGQNETGVLQPIAELAAICSRHNIPLHTDAAQVAGKIPLNFRELGAATMTVAAHKFNGPVGIGALIIRNDVELIPQLFGGFQQTGLRPGTEPVVLAVGMCRALELCRIQQCERATRMRDLRDQFESAILTGYPEAVIIGAAAERLPHTSNVAFVGLDRQMLFMALDQAGVACSTGSACASGSSEPSPVLIAMGCEPGVISSALRFSLGVTTTAAEINEACRRILQCCNNLRRAK